ncbi:putative 4-hydroxybenzoate polyprenyltransferase [Desulfuromonas sp. KJ2020]|uniref:UbiA-like polyprenyltransferase n=1 Tax=Desulfuromonas sp. KJ2020 TaxID=2919173 RepID=UPI0003212363|nr:UbiA-like polyprenyltransferase [Desulfuromonas sp. KJ2020]MCP3176320.1 putative 4-hydroxybenzoate polyprenyltransferase [Desulfuromonas sp. KJ2020]
MTEVSFWERGKTLLEMIKFSHTVFAFPFALMGVILASLASAALPTLMQIVWICLAMVGARSGAMGLNRIIDARIDAQNPRTAQRHIPAGKVSRREAWIFVLASFALLLFSAWMLNPLCLKLSPLALFFLALYSFCKRFTALAHIVLGICLAAAPIGAWIALRGDVSWQVLVLGLAVLFWVAGFDILYALQDLDFDREQNLHSIPARLGVERSLLLARSFHAVMVFLLALLLSMPGLGWIYLLGVLVVTGLLFYEHLLVKADDLSRLDAAFFNMNGYISVTIFVFTLVDSLV